MKGFSNFEYVNVDKIREQNKQQEIKDEEYLLAHPFNPRKEVSEDARYIVNQIRLIFVILPFVGALLYYLLR